MGSAFGSSLDPDEAMRTGIGQVTRPLGSRPVDRASGRRASTRCSAGLIETTRLGHPGDLPRGMPHRLHGAGRHVVPVAAQLRRDVGPRADPARRPVIRRQMRAVGTHQGLAPVADVAARRAVGARRGDVGEDPYPGRVDGLARTCAGLQGDDPATGIVATLKHFCRLLVQRGRAGTSRRPHVGRRELTDVFLLPFEMAIKAGAAESVMNSYQEVDGERRAASRWLAHRDASRHVGLRRLRRRRLRRGDVPPPVRTTWPRTSGGGRDGAARRARRRAADPAEFPAGVADRIERGLLDRSTGRPRGARACCALKFRLGSLRATRTSTSMRSSLDTPAERALAQRWPERSIVLLANDGMLPLDPACVASRRGARPERRPT